MKISIPVSLIIYKRSDTLAELLEVLKKVKPSSLYIIADGPKNSKEKVLTDQARRVVEEAIDWKCGVEKIYSKKNLGLRRRIVSGLNKVFELESKAIILEDDCIPDPSFFKFCDQLLDKYKNEEKILSISGDNFSGVNIGSSYYFSKYFHSWGWATWKRAWNRYDDKMTNWPKLKKSKWLETVLSSKTSIFYWSSIFDQVFSNKIGSWAYRWSYTHFINKGLSIVPSVNLVENIGINTTGTNTKIQSKITNQKASSLSFPLSHPKKVSVIKKADTTTERNVYSNPRNLIIQLFKGLV